MSASTSIRIGQALYDQARRFGGDKGTIDAGLPGFMWRVSKHCESASGNVCPSGS